TLHTVSISLPYVLPIFRILCSIGSEMRTRRSSILTDFILGAVLKAFTRLTLTIVMFWSPAALMTLTFLQMYSAGTSHGLLSTLRSEEHTPELQSPDHLL